MTTRAPTTLAALRSAPTTAACDLFDSLYCQLNNNVSCLLVSIPNFKGTGVSRSSEQAPISDTCISVH